MSDRPNGAAPAAADAGAAPVERPAHTEHEVASVLAGLLPDDDDVEAQDQETSDTGDGAEELGAGPDESTATSGDEPDESDEPAAEPAIEAPAGWTAEDKKVWATAPRAVQEIFQRREVELTGRMTRATMEATERDRALQTLHAAVEQERSQYVQAFAAVRDVVLSEARQLEGIDWARLAAENPAEYIRLDATRKAMQDKVALIQGHVGGIQQRQQQEAAQRTEQMRQQGRRALVDAMPEFGDPEKGPKLAQKLGAYLRNEGFTDQEIGSVLDHRPLLVARKAMLWDEAQKAQQTVQQKRTPKPAPQVQRPGTSPPAQNGTQRRSAQLAERFGQTRSARDAAAIIESWLPP